jgi:hypothetical protein
LIALIDFSSRRFILRGQAFNCISDTTHLKFQAIRQLDYKDSSAKPDFLNYKAHTDPNKPTKEKQSWP